MDDVPVAPTRPASPERRAAAKACLNPEQADRVSEGDYVHLLGRRITVPGDVAVVNPLPGSPWAEPDATLESMLTLTTCHPLYSNSERLIVHAVLVETISKTSALFPRHSRSMNVRIPLGSAPGPRPVKALLAIVLVVAVVLLLMEFVFPWVSEHMPYSDVTV